MKRAKRHSRISRKRGLFIAIWFVLNQTEGAEYKPESLPDWDESQALASLAIERTPFDELDGNIQGFASKRKVAINPVAAMPVKTLFHELAHVVLGHTAEGKSKRRQ